MKTKLAFLLLFVVWVLTIAAKPFENPGPYNLKPVIDFTKYTNSDTSLWVELDENPKECGGIEYNNDLTGRWETLRRFRILHNWMSFENIVFSRTNVTGTWRWIAKLGPHNVAGKKLGVAPQAISMHLLSVSDML